MAQITYVNKVALNENPNVPAINKVRDADMNEIKEVINQNETKILLAVSDTAPSECSTGDVYFNTTTNLLYTATATDTWGSTGEAPTENTIYIEFISQTAYAYDGTTLISVGGGAGGGDTTPIGTVEAYTGTTAPNGYLLCDGSAVSRTTYSDLFNVIGTTYGSGDGSTTFNLPDIKGRVVVMLDVNDTDFDTLGETGGSKTDNLSSAYTKMVDDGNGKLYFNVSGGKNWTSTNYLSVSGSTSASQNSTYGINLGGSVSRVQPYIVLNYIIKVQKLAGEVLSEQLPVGTEVDFDGQASDIPIGWEQVSGKSLATYDLYSNSNGSNTDITLSDSATNYNYIEIFYRSIDNVYSSLKVDSPNTKLINLTAFYAGGADIYNYSCNYTINGTSITRGIGVNWYILSNTTVSSSNAYNIYITKVIGYKEV